MARHFGGYSASSQRQMQLMLGGLAGMFMITVSLLGVVIFSPSPAPVSNSQPTKSTDNEVSMTRVLVPIQDIESGESLQAVQFRMETRPTVGVERGSVRTLEELKGQFAKSDIIKGHPLYQAQLTNVQPINRVISSIPEGYRAVAIRTDVEQAVEGWVQPGVYIDLDWITNFEGQSKLLRIVRNAKVISAERDTQSAGNTSGRIPNTITIAVTDEDSQFLNLARSNGKLEIALRGEGVDVVPTNSGPVSITEMVRKKSNLPDEVHKCNGSMPMANGERLYLSSSGQWVANEDKC